MADLSIVVASPEAMSPNWRWIAHHFPSLKWQFYYPVNTNYLPLALSRLWTCCQTVWGARKAQIMVSHGPYMAFYCALLKWLLNVKAPHVVYSFNFAELPVGFAKTRMRFAFQKIDCMVVASHMEIRLYSDYFKISEQHFDFVRWGVAPPHYSNQPVPLFRYICAVGGNARDYATFMAAMQHLSDASAIVVVRPHNLLGLEIPPNVQVLTNIPKAEAYSVIANSQLMVLPLQGNEIPCGHVTIVVAMYLGVPTVVTASAGIDDYIKEGETGLTCAPQSVDAMVKAIRYLFDNPEIAQAIAQRAQQFAEENCSEQNYVNHFQQIITNLVNISHV